MYTRPLFLFITVPIIRGPVSASDSILSFRTKDAALDKAKGDEMRKSKSYDHMNGRESWGQIGSALKPLLRVARPSLSADEGRVAEKEKKKKDDCKPWQSMRAAKRLIMRVADVISLP